MGAVRVYYLIAHARSITLSAGKKMKKIDRNSVLRFIAYAKYITIGAIGGLAVINTVSMFVSQIKPTDSIETIAMGAGAAITIAAIKAIHIL